MIIAAAPADQWGRLTNTPGGFTLNHRVSHPTPVEGCFGCKTLGVGFQGLKSNSDDPTRSTPVINEDMGERGGQKIGQHTEHWDGRQDATVYAPKIKLETRVKVD